MDFYAVLNESDITFLEFALSIFLREGRERFGKAVFSQSKNDFSMCKDKLECGILQFTNSQIAVLRLSLLTVKETFGDFIAWDIEHNIDRPLREESQEQVKQADKLLTIFK